MGCVENGAILLQQMVLLQILVIDYDKKGKPYYKRAFNTQACEQLNSWLGGFELILKHMKSGNFNWFLNTMLFYHTRHVLEKYIFTQSLIELIESDQTLSKNVYKV